MNVEDAINKRRSVRKFKDKEISADEVMDLLDAARKAPSSGNLQSWKFILVKNQDSKNQVADACFQQNWISSAPLIIVVVALMEDVKRHYGVRGEMLYSVQNCALAVENLLLRATDLGLSATFVSAFEEGMIKRLLKIPDHTRPQAIIPIGFSDEVHDTKLLESLESMCYFEQYGGRVEDFDEAFYQWSGMAKKQVDKLLRKVKKGSVALKDRINEKVNKKD
ncbi:nitroreductase family protein [Candidatus Woesearchaeota archaeon]|jgi:nitroreductase|nr:nitroreductase family protein [Candidatus Woesearchaeota archaeon]MBT4368042.1 nitroreductase family protein [Candidatus Woesearchaeota archaeon]MBT4712530.1 nitroreductase family protein [Candidatus Woesearchaeota archaeon]MBT6639443.1 nitroreductase family protein [Candidatus Woesearchaeota archaeon]MBT7133615.1 nitroreductase family protein [Candidatus Woesearchaeota archaeon]